MISAIVLTKNEEKNIIDCIDSILWCDEIIVIDDDSTDNTRELIKSRYNNKVTIHKHELQANFAMQRTYGLQKAKGDWVLFIDADERVSSALQYEILGKINDTITGVSGYFIKRKDVIWGKELQYGETASIKIMRLAKRQAGKWSGNVHETWKIQGKTETLNHHLLHYPHQSIKEFLTEINHYTDLRANELFTQKKKVSFIDIIVYPSGKFVMNYIFKLGILDGIHGIIFALFMSMHSFLVRGKLWTLWQKK